ncbi:MAG: amidohydrolase family protein [Pseudomonadota bacterium]
MDSKTIPIIDAHAHFVPKLYRDYLAENNLLFADTFPMPKWDAKVNIETMDKMNIAGSILSLSSPDFYLGDKNKAREVARDCNELGARTASDYPKRFGFFATLPLPDIEGSLIELEYAFDVLHADGVNFRSNTYGLYLGQPELDPIFEELNKRSAVVTMHPTKPSAVPQDVLTGIPIPMMEFQFDTTRAVANMIFNGIFQRFPNIKFVVPHMGAIIPLLYCRWAATMGVLVMLKVKPEGWTPPDVLAALKGLYYDFAGNFDMPVQVHTLKAIGSLDNCVYGSDLPHTPQHLAEKWCNDLRNTDLLTEAEKVNVLHNTGLKLFPRFQ